MVTSRPLACDGASSEMYLIEGSFSRPVYMAGAGSHLQGSHCTRTSDGETDNATPQNHAPDLVCRSLDQCPDCEQCIGDQYGAPTTPLVGQDTRKGTRNERKQAGT